MSQYTFIINTFRIYPRSLWLILPQLRVLQVDPRMIASFWDRLLQRIPQVGPRLSIAINSRGAESRWLNISFKFWILIEDKMSQVFVIFRLERQDEYWIWYDSEKYIGVYDVGTNWDDAEDVTTFERAASYVMCLARRHS